MNDERPGTFDLQTRTGFLNLAGLFEGGLALLAFGLGWMFDVDPLRSFAVHWTDFAWGCAAAGGLLVLLLGIEYLPVEGLRKIKRLLIDFLGRPLNDCRWFELVALAILVGFSEELLFRGFLQPWLERSMTGTQALIWSNVVFGLLHAVSFLYFLLAAFVGMILGWLLDATGSRRLLIPMTTHAVYDFVAFLWIARAYREQRSIEVNSAPDADRHD